ncbi:MAG: hypothetical protein F6K40_09965 [Okeania sp. SIO3I5]|nr:hypothetical protein [Okeania sp. SIO3I5]NEQ36581.1 hypothetical protein [Okeania sp. SIO3I5]
MVVIIIKVISDFFLINISGSARQEFCHGWLDTNFATDIRINLILEWHS